MIEKPIRKSIRLDGYDYSQCGAYFITLVVQHRLNLFGEIHDGIMELNPAGMMIEKWWNEIPTKFTDIELDTMVIMPNHVHGIIVNVGYESNSLNINQPTGTPLPQIVQWFKTMSTNEYIRCVKQYSWPGFDGSLWQRNYYDRIIRNTRELEAIRLYIQANPMNWVKDKEYLL
jgi:putative transposase